MLFGTQVHDVPMTDPVSVVQDEAAFSSVVDRWYGSSLRLARAISRDEDMSRQATHDAWVDSIPQLAELSPFTPAHVILLRASFRRLAAQLRSRESKTPSLGDRFEAPGHRWAGWWKDDRAPVDWDEKPADAALVAAIERLDPAPAAVLILRDVESLRESEVESILGLSPADQMMLLHSARTAVLNAVSKEVSS